MSRYAALARQAVAEGVVLLKNEAVLPLAPGGRAALFGYAQFHYYKSGTGSGGLVNVTHVPNLPEILGGDGGCSESGCSAVSGSYACNCFGG